MYSAMTEYRPYKIMKILIVDDHALFRGGLCHVLQDLDEQVDVLEASNCDCAMQHVEANPDLDLVLLDLNMPGEDGFEVIKRLKRDPITASIPVIFLTSKSELDSKMLGFDLGAVDYVTKPFHVQEPV